MALKTGLIDAIPTTPLYAEWNQCFTLAKYMSDVKWAPLVGATVVSKAVWEKIPEAQRGPMLQAARDSGRELRNGIRGMGDKAIAAMTAGLPGKRMDKLKVVHADDAALADWRKQTEAVYPKMSGKLIPEDLFDEVRRLRDEYRAREQGRRQMNRPGAFSGIGEKALAIAAMSLMALLPVAELIARQAGLSGVPGSTVFVQHLTLWVAFLGAALAANSDRLLALRPTPSCRRNGPRRCACSPAADRRHCRQPVLGQLSVRGLAKRGRHDPGLGIPRWVALSHAGRLSADRRARHPRRGSAVGPPRCGFFFCWCRWPCTSRRPRRPRGLWIAIPAILVGAVLGLPIFATLGGIALLLFWNVGLPVASVPVETYRLVASPVLPSLPLFTLAGYLLVEGGASCGCCASIPRCSAGCPAGSPSPPRSAAPSSPGPAPASPSSPWADCCCPCW